MRVFANPHPSGPIPERRRALRGFAALLAASLYLLAGAAWAQAAPVTTIVSTPAQNSTSGTFDFVADLPVLRFECGLDAFTFSECSSPLPVSGLTAGPHTFRARAIGLDNSVGIADVYDWTIDLTRPDPPVLGAPPDNLLTRFAVQTFSGTAEPLARVLLFDGVNQFASTPVGSDGNWSYTPLTPIADGTHLWRARTLDPAGNRSDYTATRTLKIDTIAPAAPAIAAPAAAAKVNTRTPTFSGTAEPQATVSVSEGVTRFCATAAAPNGNWSCPSEVLISDGDHTVQVVARDAAGNEGPVTERSFSLDATPPLAPTILAPADGLNTTATQLEVSGTASPLARVKIYDAAVELIEVTAGLDGAWSHTFDPVAEGDYVVTAREIDDFENLSSASPAVHVRVDRTPPVAGFEAKPAAQSNQANAAFVFSSSESPSTYECALDGGDWAACAQSSTFPGLGEGPHTLMLRATDAAGNLSDAAQYDWQIDLTPPAVPTVETPADGATLTNARPTFGGHADPSVNVEVFIGSGSIGTAPSASIGGAWALTPGSALAQGTLQVQARAIDAAGNASAKSSPRVLKIDSIAPVTTITGSTASPTNAQTFSVTFISNDPLASLSCSFDSGVFTPCSSPYTSPVVAEGAHNLRVRGSDPAGNLESPAKSVAVMIDRTAPVVQSFLIAGSAGSDGVPAFQIASDDPAATARCKLDNAAFVDCSGQYRPAAGEGIHALTVRFSDPAGNSDDQVIAFNVVRTAPENPYVPPVEQPVCDVLGAAGKTTGRLTLKRLSGSRRELRVSVSSRAAALARFDVSASGKVLASQPAALRSGSSRVKVKLKSALRAGKRFEVATRFYSVKREFGTARLAGTATSSGYVRTSGAQSKLETICPVVKGAGPKARFALSGAKAGKRVTVKARGRRPTLAAIRVFRAGASVPVADSLIAIGPSPATQKLNLIRGAKLARGGYRFEFTALAAGGAASNGRGAFLVR